jgi:hypothetical protein
MPQDNLLLYNHAKLMAEDNHSSGKEYLVSIMFSHYDQNNNGALEREELEQVCSGAAIVFHLQNYAMDTVKICHLVGAVLCNLSYYFHFILHQSIVTKGEGVPVHAMKEYG